MHQQKTVKLPTFDGKQDKFLMWWVQFRAYATVHKFVEAIGDVEEDDMSADKAAAIDTNTAAGWRQDAAKKWNAMSLLSTLTLDT